MPRFFLMITKSSKVMNNILIPTDYQYDTLHALEMTWRNGGAFPVQVVLLSFSPVPDSITDFILPPSRSEEAAYRQILMNEWKTRQSLIDNQVQLLEHHQYGASASVINQIMDRYEIGQVIIPHSFQKSELLVHLNALDVFRKGKHKTIWMPEQNKALSLKEESNKVSRKKLHELVEG